MTDYAKTFGAQSLDMDEFNKNRKEKIKLEDKFIIPPFSVFDTKQGYWQDRKRYWLSLGIQSEIGRGENLLEFSDTILKAGKDGWTGTSIFDPVLCEISYRWFCPERGKILDPFAGGSVRGIVAAKEGYEYLGIDLNKTQIEANIQQGEKIIKEGEGKAHWIQGDSNVVLDSIADEAYDLIFSCPPYHDLEVYGDDDADLSNMPYPYFLQVYESIIKKALAKLKPNRFAIFTVGDLRDEQGFYKNFVEDTVKIFERNGARKYNEIILLKAIGTLPLRTARVFPSFRKVGKAHENVLVFFKGDPQAITTDFNKIDELDQKQAGIFDF